LLPKSKSFDDDTITPEENAIMGTGSKTPSTFIPNTYDDKDTDDQDVSSSNVIVIDRDQFLQLKNRFLRPIGQPEITSELPIESSFQKSGISSNQESVKVVDEVRDNLLESTKDVTINTAPNHFQSKILTKSSNTRFSRKSINLVELQIESMDSSNSNANVADAKYQSSLKRMRAAIPKQRIPDNIRS
jgi:hypothetical protein